MSNPQEPSRGLGDTIAKLTHATGIDRAVEKLAGGRDCGCKGRREVLNRLVPYGATGNADHSGEEQTTVIESNCSSRASDASGRVVAGTTIPPKERLLEVLANPESLEALVAGSAVATQFGFPGMHNAVAVWLGLLTAGFMPLPLPQHMVDGLLRQGWRLIPARLPSGSQAKPGDLFVCVDDQGVAVEIGLVAGLEAPGFLAFDHTLSPGATPYLRTETGDDSRAPVAYLLRA